jgi:virginiamycin A acetyltransferase
MKLTDPTALHPQVFPDGTVNTGLVQLSVAIRHPNIEVGHRTYASDFDPPEDWAARLAPYLYPGAPERLVIGRYGQIAQGARFITASANHAMGGITTYPFAIFDPAALAAYGAEFEGLPDTVVGHDVWIGHGAMLLPGLRIGSGAIVGAGAVVARDVPPYAVVAGNPARVVRMRFPEAEVARLLDFAWWDWPDERIEAALPALLAADVRDLARFAP